MYYYYNKYSVKLKFILFLFNIFNYWKIKYIVNFIFYFIFIFYEKIIHKVDSNTIYYNS